MVEEYRDSSAMRQPLKPNSSPVAYKNGLPGARFLQQDCLPKSRFRTRRKGHDRCYRTGRNELRHTCLYGQGPGLHW